MRRLKLEGQKINDWTVLEFTEQVDSVSYYLCECVCGVRETVRGYNLKSGRSHGCTECGRKRTNAALFGKDKSKYGPQEASYRRAWKDYSKRAKRKRQAFELSFDAFKRLILLNCFYCGIGPGLKYNGTNGGSVEKLEIRKERFDAGWVVINGVDRIVPSEGYTPENCVPCCFACNTAKLDYSLKEFKDWIERVYTHLIKKP
jgi:hypothetical protein